MKLILQQVARRYSRSQREIAAVRVNAGLAKGAGKCFRAACVDYVTQHRLRHSNDESKRIRPVRLHISLDRTQRYDFACKQLKPP